MPKRIFITGASGYIGGSVLSTLLQYPDRFELSALVRSTDQAAVLKKLGVAPILGALDDLEVLSKAASEADAVINTADADHLPAVQALVKGLKSRNDKKAVFLHTSGTGVLTYSGTHTEVPFDDADIARIHAIPITALHKPIDSWIFENTDDLVSAIIAPSTINGIGTGPFKKTSQQVVNMARASAARRKPGYVGPRKDTIWSNVNIHDLADLYLLVLNGLFDGTIEYGKQGGWYFGAVHEHTWYHTAELLAAELKKLGLVDSTEISEFEQSSVDRFLYGEAGRNNWTGDSRAVSNRSKKIGWNPHRPDVYATLPQEVKYLHEHGDLTF